MSDIQPFGTSTDGAQPDLAVIKAFGCTVIDFSVSADWSSQAGSLSFKIIEDDVLQKITEKCLKRAVLWDEVMERLDDSAMGLSGGQQQRLCIARALAVEPEVLLMDEPTASLDPIATQKIEDLILQLKEEWTVIIVTHNMQQAARISDYTAFMYLGEMIEYGETTQIFENPQKK